MTVIGDVKRFHLEFETGFLKKKNGVKMECGSTNLMGSTKWAYHKEWTFAIDYIYLKSYFEYKNLLKIVDYCNSSPNIRIHAFRKYFSFI